MWEAFSKEPRPELDGLPHVEEVAGRQRRGKSLGMIGRHSLAAPRPQRVGSMASQMSQAHAQAGEAAHIDRKTMIWM